MADAEIFIQEGGFPVPEGSDVAVGTWTCPKDGYTVGPLRSTTSGITAIVECPYCHTAAEIMPEVVDDLG